MLRRNPRLWLLALPIVALVTTLIALRSVSAMAPRQGADYPIPDCVTALTKSAVPDKLYVGDEALVTAVISSTCPAYELPLDLVLLVDKSNSMTKGQPGAGVDPGATKDPNETPGVAPGFPTVPAPGLVPTRDPGINPNGAIEPEAAVARQRGLAQAIATTPPKVPPPNETPTKGGATPTVTGGLVPPRGEVESPGTDDNIREMQQGVADFLEDIQDQVKAGKIRVALVSFDDRAHTLVSLTDNVPRVRSLLSRIRGGGNTRLDLGLQAAQRELVGATARGRTDLDHSKAVIVWTDGIVDPRTVTRLRTREAVKVFAVGVGRTANQATLRRIASDQKWTYKITDRRGLLEDFNKLTPNTRQIIIPAMDMFEQLADGISLVPGSANPAPAAVTGGNTMSWHFQPWTAPVTVTYRVRPLEAGTWPVTLVSKVNYTDSEKRAVEVAFPEVKIEALKAGVPLAGR
jgi:uncharacterized protein YegL